MGGETPWRHAPAANGSLPRRKAGKGMLEHETLPGPRLMRRVLVPALLGETLLYWPAAHAWGLGTAWTQDSGGHEPEGWPCLSSIAQGCVWGGFQSTPSQTSPLIREQKAFLSGEDQG